MLLKFSFQTINRNFALTLYITSYIHFHTCDGCGMMVLFIREMAIAMVLHILYFIVNPAIKSGVYGEGQSYKNIFENFMLILYSPIL